MDNDREISEMSDEEMEEEEESVEEVGDDKDEEDPIDSSIQVLLSRLGVTGFDLSRFATGANVSKVRQLLAGLKDLGDEDHQLISLTELCDILSVGTEDTLAGLPVEDLVPAIVTLMNMDHNPDIMLLATRALYYLIEALPGSSVTVVANGAINSLCEKLLSIEYIDLAEQSLMALEKLSQEHGISVFKAGGMSASLSYLDFFSTSLQRVAMSIATNLCRYVPPDCFHMVVDMVPTLTTLLSYPDSKIVERASVCFERLVEAFQSDPEKLSQLTTANLVPNLMSVATTSFPANSNTFTIALHTLSLIYKGCPSQTRVFFDNGMVKILKGLIGGGDGESMKIPEVINTTDDKTMGSNQWVTRYTTEQWCELLSLTSELLPPLPNQGVFAAPSLDSQTRTRTVLEALKRRRQITTAEALATQPGPTNQEDARAIIFRNDVTIVEQITSMLPTLLTLFQLTVSANVRAKAIHASLKMIYITSPTHLETLLSDLPLAGICSTMLGSSDIRLVTNGIQLTELLMTKLPDMFRDRLRREGVVDDMKRLSESEVPPPPQPRTKPTRSHTHPFTTRFGSEPIADPISSQSPRDVIEPSNEALPPNKSVDQTLSGIKESEKDKKKTSGEKSGSDVMVTSQGDDKEPSTPDHQSSTHTNPPAPSSLTTSTSSPPSPSSPPLHLARLLLNPPEYEAKIWVKNEATRFLNDYNFNSGNLLASPVLNTLTTLSEKLKENPSDYGKSIFEELRGVFTDQNSGVTSFELLESNLIHSLLTFFTQLGDEDTEWRRLKEFSITFFERPSSSHVPAVIPFLDKLQGLLNKAERYKVAVHELSSSSSTNGVSTLSSSLRIIMHPIGVRLVRDANQEAKLKETSNIVMVEPLAAMYSLENFLWPLVCLDGDEPDDVADETEDNDDDTLDVKGANDSTDEEEVDDEIDVVTSSIQDRRTELDLTESGTNSHSSTSPDPHHHPKQGNDLPTSALSTETDNKDKPSEEEPQAGSPSANGPDAVKVPKLVFSLNGHVLDQSMTLFHAIDKFANSQLSTNLAGGYEGRRLGRYWKETYTLTYSLYDPSIHKTNEKHRVPELKSHSTSINLQATNKLRALGQSLSVIKDLMTFNSNDPLYDIICMLKLLQLLNRRGTSVVDRVGGLVIGSKEFQNTKITAKMTRQLADPFSVASLNFPDWCLDIIKAVPFLVPFELRQLYMQLTTFGTARALTILQQRMGVGDGTGEELRVARIQRAKAKVSRDAIFDSCLRLMTKYGTTRAVLEIEYADEAGTGLGPTLEFYALCSKEFQRCDRKIWRESDQHRVEDPSTNDMTVHSLCGLYPSPLVMGQDTAYQLHLFNGLGRFMARTLLDSRLIDIPLSPAFYLWLAGRQEELDIHSLMDVDPFLYRSLSDLAAYSDQVAAINNDVTLSESERTNQISHLSIRGSMIGDLCLDFTLPGYPDIELKPNGSNEPVTNENIGEYVALVVDWTLYEGVRLKMKAFYEGFAAVLPLSPLSSFSPQELELLFCGATEKWDMEMLIDNTKPDHGFTRNSPLIKWLLEIMAGYTNEEQRRFLQFVTGSPRLPVGGLSSLTPKLTIVRKDAISPLGPDDYLPSVMTCVNYLKLP
eukprot:Ihof_evm6s105 gene=Ihof_evmTU6s105